MTAGLLIVALHLTYFSQLGADATFWQLLPALMLGGVGMALTMTPSAAAATRAVQVDKAGVGAAVLNASRQVGGSIGIALMGAIMAHEIAGDRTPEAFMVGFERALEVAAIFRGRAWVRGHGSRLLEHRMRAGAPDPRGGRRRRPDRGGRPVLATRGPA